MFTDYETKAKSMKKKKLQINAPLKNLKPGMVIEIQVDKDNIPLERYWRDRVKDSKLDNCVEFVKGSKK